MKKLIDWFVKTSWWTKLGKYMEPEIQFVNGSELPDGFGGYCKYGLFSCTIKINEKYINDKGIQKHELAHARQFGRLLWIHSALSFLIGKYNLLIELECYRSQVKEYNYSMKEDYEWIIEALDTKYTTWTSKEKIREYTDYTFKDLL